MQLAARPRTAPEDTGRMSGRRTSQVGEHRRFPVLAVAAWTLAAVVLAVLAVAVARFLARDPASASASVDSMGMSRALFRGNSPVGAQTLLGSRLITAWQLDAVALAILVLLAATYLTGVGLVGVRAPHARWPLRRTAAFFAGLAVCAYATNGAIAVYDEALFSAHMVGHLALVMLAPALLVAGRPLTLALAAVTPERRSRLQNVLQGRVISLVTAPPVVLACYIVAIVGSHLTGLMNTIMRVTWAGQLEHLVYVLVGCQFFVLVLGAEPIRWRLGAPARWLLLAIAMAVDTFTGVILLQATSPIAMLSAPGLSVGALSDTHTGGAIMWFGGDAIMAAVMITLVVGWLHRPESRAQDEQGWIEQARRATFAAHTGSAEPPAEGFDDDEDARAAYNRWLARLDR